MARREEMNLDMDLRYMDRMFGEQERLETQRRRTAQRKRSEEEAKARGGV